MERNEFTKALACHAVHYLIPLCENQCHESCCSFICTSMPAHCVVAVRDRVQFAGLVTVGDAEPAAGAKSTDDGSIAATVGGLFLDPDGCR